MQLSNPRIAEAAVMTPEDYQSYARHQAEFLGVSQEQLLGTISCETSGTWDPTIQSNAYKNGKREQSFGLAQINAPAHPEISYEQATDGIFSINWMAQQFKAGNQHIWTCWRDKYGSNSP